MDRIRSSEGAMLNLKSLDKFDLINLTKILHEARFPDEENDSGHHALRLCD